MNHKWQNLVLCLLYKCRLCKTVFLPAFKTLHEYVQWPCPRVATCAVWINHAKLCRMTNGKAQWDQHFPFNIFDTNFNTVPIPSLQYKTSVNTLDKFVHRFSWFAFFPHKIRLGCVSTKYLSYVMATYIYKWLTVLIMCTNKFHGHFDMHINSFCTEYV